MHTRASGERLRGERERLGLNQEELGQIGGVNRNSQGKYEKGERNPDSVYLAAIASAGVDVLYVLAGTRTSRPVEGLSVTEEKVLDDYRSLPEEDQAFVRRLTNALAESVAGNDVKKKTAP